MRHQALNPKPYMILHVILSLRPLAGRGPDLAGAINPLIGAGEIIAVLNPPAKSLEPISKDLGRGLRS